MATPLTITIDDPEVIGLLQVYEQYAAQVDGVTGTLDELAEGLVHGLLDSHSRFRAWTAQGGSTH